MQRAERHGTACQVVALIDVICRDLESETPLAATFWTTRRSTHGAKPVDSGIALSSVRLFRRSRTPMKLNVFLDEEIDGLLWLP